MTTARPLCGGGPSLVVGETPTITGPAPLLTESPRVSDGGRHQDSARAGAITLGRT